MPCDEVVGSTRSIQARCDVLTCPLAQPIDVVSIRTLRMERRADRHLDPAAAQLTETRLEDVPCAAHDDRHHRPPGVGSDAKGAR